LRFRKSPRISTAIFDGCVLPLPLKSLGPRPSFEVRSPSTRFFRSLGPLVSASSQHRRTPEIVLQKGHASFRITSSPPLQRIAAEPAKGYPQSGMCFLGPLGFDFARH
jgi:hypothetical protein